MARACGVRPRSSLRAGYGLPLPDAPMPRSRLGPVSHLCPPHPAPRVTLCDAQPLTQTLSNNSSNFRAQTLVSSHCKIQRSLILPQINLKHQLWKYSWASSTTALSSYTSEHSKTRGSDLVESCAFLEDCVGEVCSVSWEGLHLSVAVRFS